MLRASQNNPRGRRGGGGDDRAEDAGDPPCSSPAVFQGLARGHYFLCRGVAPLLSYAAASRVIAASTAYGTQQQRCSRDVRRRKRMVRSTTTDASSRKTMPLASMRPLYACSNFCLLWLASCKPLEQQKQHHAARNPITHRKTQDDPHNMRRLRRPTGPQRAAMRKMLHEIL